MQTIKPSGTNLFCSEDKAQERTTSTGIFVPVKAQEKPQTATVINVGPDVKGFSQKDTIVYKPYATTPLKLEGKEYFLIAEEDVLGTLV